MLAQDGLTGLRIGHRYPKLTLETPGTKQGRVDILRIVGRPNQHHAVELARTVDRLKQTVNRLALIVDVVVFPVRIAVAE